MMYTYKFHGEEYRNTQTVLKKVFALTFLAPFTRFEQWLYFWSTARLDEIKEQGGPTAYSGIFYTRPEFIDTDSSFTGLRILEIISRILSILRKLSVILLFAATIYQIPSSTYISLDREGLIAFILLCVSLLVMFLALLVRSFGGLSSKVDDRLHGRVDLYVGEQTTPKKKTIPETPKRKTLPEQTSSKGKGAFDEFYYDSGSSKSSKDEK